MDRLSEDDLRRVLSHVSVQDVVRRTQRMARRASCLQARSAKAVRAMFELHVARRPHCWATPKALAACSRELLRIVRGWLSS